MPATTIPVTIEFTGGLELLFSNQRRHKLAVPSTDSTGKPTSVEFLIQWLCETHMTDSRRDMFVLDDSVRPGILVLINNADWELEGEGEYKLQAGDEILFVSTLHGG